MNDIAIAEGGDFGKAEKILLEFKNCVDDGDCDHGDFNAIPLCRGRGTACVCFSKACYEYSHMMRINTTACNFLESATWVIEDEEGITKHEGGTYKLSKR